MRAIIITIAFLLLSCGNKNYEHSNIEKKPKKDNHLVLEDMVTSNGNVIKFKKIGEQSFLQWNRKNKLETLDYPFDLNGADAWLPRFVAENDNYLLFRAGCGSSCWTGFILPLNKNGNVTTISEYLAYDLNQNYVAYLNYDTDNLEVLNIASGEKQSFTTESCDAAFKGYCIDTIYFKQKKICYKWTTNANQDSKRNSLIELVLKI
ncbi:MULTISPECIES: hypothetical protein [unclassified Flavobacterium]|jgi:hypothetical protein|uniref:hypothetical protein n=1 Tax=unclassified Flavobacterium TaxID=196869 RepID=UPI0025C56036|nr:MULTISPECIES: hypothetical protein [unclassified Flavobacterium]